MSSSPPGSTLPREIPGAGEPGGLFHAPGKTAILIDGAFFVRRLPGLFGGHPTSAAAADAVERLARGHLLADRRDPDRQLYRVFFYDCPPLGNKFQRPVSRRALDLGRSPEFLFRRDLHEALRSRRKVALRLGYLDDRNVPWILREDVTEAALKSARAAGPPPSALDLAGLTDDDFRLGYRQKGVDMRVGLDIASLAFKRQVDQIVLVTGDSDFVPAAKLARREGIDFLLDPLGAGIKADLNEHVDGVRSVPVR